MEKRVIKFRGRLAHSGVWVYGNLIIASDGHPYIIPSEVLEPDGHHLQINSDNPFWVDPETVGQFTGLLDKNGNEIYEGDIIKAHKADTNYPLEYVIVFNNDTVWGNPMNGFTMRWIDRFKKKEGGFYDEHITPSKYKAFEVIGNIYETQTATT